MTDICRYLDAAASEFAGQKHSKQKIGNDLYLDGCFREKASNLFFSVHPRNGKRAVSAHSHSYTELLYVHRGSLDQTVNGCDMTLGQGRLMLLGTGAFHCPDTVGEADIVVNMGIRTERLKALLARFDLGSALAPLKCLLDAGRSLTLPGSDTVSALINEMFCEYYRQDEYAEQVLLGDLIHLTVELLRNANNGNINENTNQDKTHADLLEDIRSYINTNYSFLTMQKLSAHFSYSERQLRRFLAELNEGSLPELLNRLRIRHACEALTSDMPINEIAACVGFNDTAYFYKVFKHYTGMTVNEYKRGRLVSY